jgi:hypothetical protein
VVSPHNLITAPAMGSLRADRERSGAHGPISDSGQTMSEANAYFAAGREAGVVES